ncbi:hypothetical protein JX266_002724 [Neoarthrinium moseri]|nr:hypothetical protein JX266_002724 [Neoarthrinium moseri]
MNSHGHDRDYADRSRSHQTYATHSTQNAHTTPPPTASQVTVLHAPVQQRPYREESSPSDPPTVVPYVPSPPSTPEIDGPDRIFPQQQQVAAPRHVAQPPVNPHPAPCATQRQPTMARSAAPTSQWAAADFKSEMVRDVGASVTPGIDSTPYIQYALEAMTRPRQDERGVSIVHSSSSGETNPIYRFLPNALPGLFQPQPVHLPAPLEDLGTQELETSPEEELAALRRQRRANSDVAQQYVTPILTRRPSYLRPFSGGVVRLPYTPSNDGDTPEPQFSPTPTPLPVQRPREVSNWQAQSDRFSDAEKAAIYPPLTYRPWILGNQSLSILAALCTLMTAALMFSAIFSSLNDGLLAYGSMYDGRYFLFRIFPQLLAALILLYAQNVIVAAFRVLPFSALASDDSRSRRNVGFLPLYPKSFLWPQLVSTWQVWIPIFVTWIMNFTIPLQSCLFTVVYVEGAWTWSTVQGVAWVLVAMYVSMVLSTVLLIIYWRNRRTGLGPHWDMRSLADIIALLSPSNSSHQYAGTETAARRNEMRHMMYRNIERLGYWTSPDPAAPPLWYGIGVPTVEEKLRLRPSGPSIHEKGPRGQPPNVAPFEGDVRRRYLPWAIRDSQIIMWVVAASVLLITLFAVCFNSVTHIQDGFLPLLSAAPVQGAFSAADFLYAFVPALLGMIIFLSFQSLDLILRILTPWGKLSQREGALATDSILLDYAACLPLESTWKAFKRRHWRVAAVSLLSTLLILIPILAGGLFMALTPPSGTVRMYANIPVLAILLTLLFLMVGGLISLVPKRDQFRLPHAVTCLTEIISFCYTDELLTDPAFEWAQGHRLLAGKLGAYLDEDEQSRWYFGTGYNRSERLGIKRYGKYTGDTPKVAAAKQRVKEIQDMAARVLDKHYARTRAEKNSHRNISQPVSKGSTTMIGP